MPRLVRCAKDGVYVWTDPVLRDQESIVVAFSERGGGESLSPYASLNLAHHVGDVPSAVDSNRSRLLRSLGIEALRPRLTTSQQVHGDRVHVVTEGDVGVGSLPPGEETRPVPTADSLVTVLEDTPLMLLFADCVPVVLVVTSPRRAVAVVHAGWRGAAERVHVKAVASLTEVAGCDVADLVAYVGPHIGPHHYEVGPEVLSRFAGVDTIAAARDRLDLGAVVSAGLEEVGVPKDRQFSLELCTVENTNRFYSHRSEGVTGRHAAIAAILGPAR